MVLDTGSQLSWIQCHNKKKTPKVPPPPPPTASFDPALSSSCDRPLTHLFQWAHDSYLEYKALKIAPVPSRTVRRVRWKPPDPGSYKLNFDGATFAEENCSGLGVIVRDKEGLVIAAMASRVPQLLQAIEIEALAANKSLEFAQEMDLTDVVLEGDSLLVMATLNSKNPGLAPYGLMMQDSLSLSSVFSKLSTLTLRERVTQLHITELN